MRTTETKINKTRRPQALLNKIYILSYIIWSIRTYLTLNKTSWSRLYHTKLQTVSWGFHKIWIVHRKSLTEKDHLTLIKYKNDEFLHQFVTTHKTWIRHYIRKWCDGPRNVCYTLKVIQSVRKAIFFGLHLTLFSLTTSK